MADTAAEIAIRAWVAAKGGLDKAETALRSAKAAHETAAQCEREAWAAIAAMRGEQPSPAPTYVPLPVGAPHLISTGNGDYMATHSWIRQGPGNNLSGWRGSGGP